MSDIKDCRNCIHWETCPCGKEGHEKGTSIGYSVGECKEYKHIKEKTMSDTERIEKIEEYLNTLGVTEMNHEEFCKELEKKSFSDIKDIGWEWYCFISDVCYVLNE